MRIMQPRTGFALVGAALLATGVTSMALAAPQQAAQPICYGTCPPKVDLQESFRVLSPDAEEIEEFTVRVGPDSIGATDTPSGTVTVKAGSVALCTITLVKGEGKCRPPADALPTDGNYVVQGFYSGDVNFPASQSEPLDLEIAGVAGGD